MPSTADCYTADKELFPRKLQVQGQTQCWGKNSSGVNSQRERLSPFLVSASDYHRHDIKHARFASSFSDIFNYFSISVTHISLPQTTLTDV